MVLPRPCLTRSVSRGIFYSVHPTRSSGVTCFDGAVGKDTLGRPEVSVCPVHQVERSMRLREGYTERKTGGWSDEVRCRSERDRGRESEREREREWERERERERSMTSRMWYWKNSVLGFTPEARPRFIFPGYVGQQHYQNYPGLSFGNGDLISYFSLSRSPSSFFSSLYYTTQLIPALHRRVHPTKKLALLLLRWDTRHHGIQTPLCSTAQVTWTWRQLLTRGENPCPNDGILRGRVSNNLVGTRTSNSSKSTQRQLYSAIRLMVCVWKTKITLNVLCVLKMSLF